MLSRKIPKLKLWSRLGSKRKGNSSTKHNKNGNDSKFADAYHTKKTTLRSFSVSSKSFGKCMLNGIPVLSIFAFLGILSYGMILSGYGFGSEEAYAETYTTTSGESSVSLTIGGAGEKEQVSAGRGVVAYRSHTVRIQASTVKDYGLTISGPANLTPPSGGTTIAGVANKTGTEMGNSSTYDNTWGYGWGATTTSDANLTYRTLSTTGTNLLTVNGTSDKPALSNRAVDFTRKLVFAVKFGENAVAGRYYANVTLSLTATPSTITTYSITYNGNSNTSGTAPAKQEQKTYDTSSYSFTASAQGTLARFGYNFLGWSESPTATSAEYVANSTITLTQSSPTKTLYAVWEQDIQGLKTITNMQQMTGAICKASAVGDTNTLTDTRDNSTYTVKKINSTQCWMTQNLRIVNKSISSTDSDMASGSFTIPASSTSGFSSETASNAYYSGDTTKGSYYTWCAATAGSCTSATSGGVNAPSSICPKGWHLPVSGTGTTGTNTGVTSDTKNDFMVLAGKTATSSFTDASLVSGTNITLGGVTWPFTGYYYNSSFGRGVAGGSYWSRTPYNYSDRAYHLDVNNNGRVDLVGNNTLRFGFSVRCVAYSS